jgi:DNA-binding Xre family transcriptional regulator
MSDLLVKRIRVLGRQAAVARAWLDDAVPAARVVDAHEEAEYVLLDPEKAAATATYRHTRDQGTVPIAMARRRVAGENPIKLWREYRGLTLKALGHRAGISKSYLSLLEAGERHGTVATLKKIAEALEVDLDELV